jgi:3-hydroxymyristoyl/3-hydroxydecanoyl-(acyl carrier protein) dehydratase
VTRTADDAPVLAARVVVPAEHPALPGHFPGRPIVPGVLLLDAVLQAAGMDQGRLRFVKFTAPVQPGDPVDIWMHRRDPARLAFTGRRGDTVVLTGEIECGRPSTPRPAIP